MEETSKKIILFDGVCNLCNGAVQFIIRRDPEEVFRFATLQSEIGQNLCKERHINTDKVDSIVLIDPGKAYYLKYEAVLEITNHLKGMGWLRVLGYVLPKSLGDLMYDLIARKRYGWFGNTSSCMVPTAELKNRFL